MGREYYYFLDMGEEFRLTMTSALILEAVGAGHCYGFDIMEATGLPSGTVYPALRRLEQLELVRSKWEGTQKALSVRRELPSPYAMLSLRFKLRFVPERQELSGVLRFGSHHNSKVARPLSRQIKNRQATHEKSPQSALPAVTYYR
jgi:PadR family transcriptional regulator, regulatory protein PadR